MSASLDEMSDAFVPHRRLAERSCDDLVGVGAAARRFRSCRRRKAGCFRSRRTRACSRTATGTAIASAHPTMLALHGLEGSSQAHYMHGLADKAWAAGFNVVRLNQRNCGGTEHLSSTLYHSGPHGGRRLRPARAGSGGARHASAIVGYSLGGNLALKLAGDYGAEAPPFLKAVVAVSPVMDLPRCVDALERPAQLRLPVELRAQPEGAHAAEGRGVSRSLLRRAAGPHPHRARFRRGLHGTALRLSRRHRLLLPRRVASRRRSDPRADADPHRRRRSVRAAGAVLPIRRSPAIRTSRRIVSRHGGHCAFVSPVNGAHDGYWAEWKAVEYCRLQIGGLPIAECRRWAPSPARRFIRTFRNLQSAIRNLAIQRASRSISRRANSGPFPSSSCLK